MGELAPPLTCHAVTWVTEKCPFHPCSCQAGELAACVVRTGELVLSLTIATPGRADPEPRLGTRVEMALGAWVALCHRELTLVDLVSQRVLKIRGSGIFFLNKAFMYSYFICIDVLQAGFPGTRVTNN